MKGGRQFEGSGGATGTLFMSALLKLYCSLLAWSVGLLLLFPCIFVKASVYFAFIGWLVLGMLEVSFKPAWHGSAPMKFKFLLADAASSVFGNQLDMALLCAFLIFFECKTEYAVELVRFPFFMASKSRNDGMLGRGGGQSALDSRKDDSMIH